MALIGVHLLEALIKKTKAKIYCLIRAQSRVEAQERLNKNNIVLRSELTAKSIKNYPSRRRFIPDQLGLVNNIFRMLSHENDYIYHNGAFVHHIYDYFHLRMSNVLSTVEHS